MGITSNLAASRLIQPGVIASSSARPAAPYEGQVVYQTDTNGVYVYDGTQWTPPWNTAWGKVSFDTNTSSDTTITSSEELQITGGTFTAVANRLYRATYYEPDIYNGTNDVRLYIRKTNVSGTLLQMVWIGIGGDSGADRVGVCQWVGTLSAGSVNLAASAISNGGTAALARDATTFAYLIVEDMGPA